ncbi:MAG TPA: hypothetical protein VF466_02765 [Candidatus Saccharimonadales bacterium]
MNRRLRALQPYAPYALLAAVVLLPFAAPGYIFTLDAAPVPHIPAPHAGGSDYLWQELLHILNSAVPSQVIEKLLFVAIILGSAIGMHRLMDFLQRRTGHDTTLGWGPARYFAGLLYAVNPFTYDRFMAGQYGVLLGYALLPFVLEALLAFAVHPDRRGMLRVALGIVLVSIVSLPTTGLAVLAGALTLAAAAWQQRRKARLLRQYVRYGLGAAGIFAVLSSYWLLPALLGKGALAQQVHTFTPAHTAAFATVGSGFVGKLAHVAQLQGFWVEPHGLFTLPQEQLPGWGTVRLLVWALAVVGAVVLYRSSRQLGATFLLIGLSGWLLAAGLAAGLLTHFGYREPQKFAALVALSMAVFAGFGVAQIVALGRARSEGWANAAVAAALVVLLLFTPTMYWGFGGQLRPRKYPDGWFAANAFLAQQGGSYQAVFLPWHEYMSFAFTADRIIANPAARFFGQPVTISNDPELGAIKPPADAAATRIGALVAGGQHTPLLAAQLAGFNVRFVLLAKDYDYRRYNYLEQQPGFHRVFDSQSLRIYENAAWKGYE